MLASYRSFMSARDPRFHGEPLATLGDSLALCRVSMSAIVGRTFDVGAYERDELHLIEVDAQGRCRWSEVFASSNLGDAIVRLYERYAELLPDGPARTRAAGIARSVALTLRPYHLDRYAETLEPGIEVVDHRMLGTWSARGAEEFLRHMRAMFDLAEDNTVRYHDVLALQPDAFLVSPIFCGTGRASGGAYEMELLALVVFGADGRHARIEWFDCDRAAEALARFDDLGPSSAEEPPSAGRAASLENAATRAYGRGLDALQARDWPRFAAFFAPGFRGIDRRKMLQMELDRDEWLVSARPIVEMTSTRPSYEVLATRGDLLMLARYCRQGSDELVGPSEIEFLLVLEVDGRGDHVGVVMFNLDDLDAAHAELDRRYTAGEAAAHAGD
jgi:hypothetical protein